MSQRKYKRTENLKSVTMTLKLEDREVLGDNLSQRACNVLESGRWVDCKFLVGKDKELIQACKLLLAIASPVFEAMLYGDMASTTAVEVPDIEPPVFKQLLRYIYCHEVKLSSIEEAFAVFSAAHKYMMPDLCDLCVSHMKHNLVSLKKSWKMWCEALNLACLYKNEDLKQFVLQEICDRGRTLLSTSPDLLILSAESLMAILQQSYLDVESEVEVVVSCTRWATARCKDKGVLADGRHLRAILMNSGVRSHIRFLTLTSKELEDGPLKSGILTQNEASLLLQYMCTNDCITLSDCLCSITEHRVQRTEGKTYNTVKVKRDVKEIKQGSVLTAKFRNNISSITLLGLTLESQVHDGQTCMHSYDEEIHVTVHYQQTSAVGLFKKKVNYNSNLHIPLNLMCRNQKISSGDFDITLKYCKSGKYPVYFGSPDPPPVKCSRCGSNGYSYSSITSTKLEDLTLLHTKLNDLELGNKLDMAISYRCNTSSQSSNYI